MAGEGQTGGMPVPLNQEPSHQGRPRQAQRSAEPAFGGTGVPPVAGECLSRRHLPHWQIAGATYFLTWRCVAGLTLAHPERDLVFSSLRHWDGSRWELRAAVVMPGHVHALARPLPKRDGCWDLHELLHSVKGYSAHRLNRARGRTGSVWLDERFDRWMRDVAEFEQKYAYIAANAEWAGLVASGEAYPWLYLGEPTGSPDDGF